VLSSCAINLKNVALDDLELSGSQFIRERGEKAMRDGRRIFTVMVWLVLFAPASARAAHPLITDDAGTQGTGKFQWEVNGEYGSDSATAQGVETVERSIETAAALTYGVTDALDAVISIPFIWLRSHETDPLTGAAARSNEKGPGDVSLELKWRFYEREGLSLAVKPGVSAPTGSERRGLGAGKYGLSAFVIATQELKPVVLHLNFGVMRNNNRAGEREDLCHLSLAAEYEAAERLRLVANIGQERNPDVLRKLKPRFGLLGVVYGITENFDIDAGI